MSTATVYPAVAEPSHTVVTGDDLPSPYVTEAEVDAMVVAAVEAGLDALGFDYSAFTAHVPATTDVHGIPDTSLLETISGAQAKADAAEAAAISTLLGGAPAAALDTILELGEALNDADSAIGAISLALTQRVTGPAAATDNGIVRYDGTTGKLVQDSLATISDVGMISTPNDIYARTGTHQVRIGSSNSRAEIIFGSAGDTVLYRAAVGYLRTDGQFSVGSNLSIFGAGTIIQQAMNGVLNQVHRVRLTADTVDRYSVLADGKIQWGDGTAASDTNLYRPSANLLKTDSNFSVGSGYLILGADVSLYRAGVDVLKTDDALHVGGHVYLKGTTSALIARDANAVANGLILSRVSTDSFDRFAVTFGGTMTWGDGANAGDTNLYRNGANTLWTDDSFGVGGATLTLSGNGYVNFNGATAVGNAILAARLTGDTTHRYYVTADGKTQWGPGGVAALDTNLYRSGVGVLRTDSQLVVGPGGAASAPATFVIDRGSGGGAATLDFKINGVQNWGIYDGGQANALFFRDYTNARQQMTLYEGATAAAALTHIHSKLTVDGTTTVAGDFNITSSGTLVSRSLNSSGNHWVQVRATADTADRFTITGAGEIAWGPGNAAQDMTLSRGGSGQLLVDLAHLRVRRAAATSTAFATIVTGDADMRYQVRADGRITWGDGTAAADTNLYRLAADHLATDDQLTVGGATINLTHTNASITARSATLDTSGLLYVRTATDAQDRFRLFYSGLMEWGPGGATTRDVNLYRLAANVLATDDEVRSIRSTGTLRGFATWTTGDVDERWAARADGRLVWGDGVAAPDINLYRIAAGTLYTGNQFWAGVALRAGTGAMTAADGQLRLGSATPSIYFDRNGAQEWLFYNGAANNVYLRDLVNSKHHVTYTGGATAAAANTQIHSKLTVDAGLTVGGDLTISSNGAGIFARNADSSTRQLFGSRVTGDNVDRFTLNAAGKHEWGPGNAAVDINLYRYGAGVLATDHRLLFNTGTATNWVLSTLLAGEGNDRFALRRDGQMLWGPGSATQDVNLYRLAADILATDDQFRSYRAAAANSAFVAMVNGDANARLIVQAGGRLDWGDGTSAVDISLYRESAGVMKLLSAGLSIQRAATSDLALASVVTGDSVPRFRVDADGKHHWGAGGASATDVTLYRAGADILATDDQFRVVRAAAANTGFSAMVTADANVRFVLLADGKMEWGPGTAGTDLNLYRSAAGTLKTDNNLVVNSTLFIDQSLGTSKTSLSGTALQFGPGTGARDTTFTRAAANWLQANSRLDVVRSLTTDIAFSEQVNGEANPRFYVTMDGKHHWGDGTAALDTNLYRSAADTLKTDDTFLAVGEIRGMSGTAYQVTLANVGGFAGISFGSGFDASLWRPAAGHLKTGGIWEAGTLQANTRLNLATPAVPATAASAGTKGDIAYDNDYLYVAVATNTWKRAALSTW